MRNTTLSFGDKDEEHNFRGRKYNQNVVHPNSALVTKGKGGYPPIWILAGDPPLGP